MSNQWLTLWNDCADWWAGGMLRSLGYGTLFILAVWAVCRLFPRLPAAARGWLWWLACLKLVIGLPGISPLSLPLLPAAPQKAAALPPPERLAPAGPAPVNPSVTERDGSAAVAAHPSPATEPTRAPSITLAGLLMSFWLAGLASALRPVRRQWRCARHLLRDARPVTQPEVHTEAARLSAALGLRRPPRLLETPAAPGPVVLGLLRPTVLLPTDATTQLSPEELRMALAHELAHVRRGDLWWSLLPHLARWLFFFHPLVPLAVREWETAREVACDAVALRATGADASNYGRLLLKLTARNSQRMLPALGATAGFELMRRRLQMLQHGSLTRRAWCGLIALVAISTLAALPWRLIARPARAATPLAVRPTDREALLSTCERKLAEIGRAVAAYRRDHGELPAHLSDLFPRYVSDLRLLHCPADRTNGSPRLADDYEDDIAPPLDPRPVSYAYYMSPTKLRIRFGGLGGPPPRGADNSWRGQMLAMREQYGDRVPVVRCWHHAQTTHEAYRQPLVPSLTMDGEVYRSVGNWQQDPLTLALALARMESDLAQDAPRFLQHWNLGQIADQFGYAPPNPALSTRLRALASKLEALADQPLTPDQGTHLSTDLPAAIGSLYHMAGDTDKAIAAYQTALDHLDRTVSYYWGGELTAAHCLPVLYAAKGEHERAIAVYERILLKDPKKWDWYISMAHEYEAMGQQEKALALRQKWEPSQLLIEKSAPDFRMTGQTGRPVAMAKLRGRVVVLFFWYAPNPRMGEVARQLDTLQQQYRERGLTVVCLARRTDQGSVISQIAQNHSYSLLLGADAIYRQYGVRDSSMLFVVDQRGRVVQRYLGYGTDPGEERALEVETRQLLGLEVATHH